MIYQNCRASGGAGRPGAGRPGRRAAGGRLSCLECPRGRGQSRVGQIGTIWSAKTAHANVTKVARRRHGPPRWRRARAAPSWPARRPADARRIVRRLGAARRWHRWPPGGLAGARPARPPCRSLAARSGMSGKCAPT
eukprot:scaffold73552_cov63-Phaeocystis_antarctica.AAC.1